jgi:hypothetical protein
VATSVQNRLLNPNTRLRTVESVCARDWANRRASLRAAGVPNAGAGARRLGPGGDLTHQSAPVASPTRADHRIDTSGMLLEHRPGIGCLLCRVIVTIVVPGGIQTAARRGEAAWFSRASTSPRVGRKVRRCNASSGMRPTPQGSSPDQCVVSRAGVTPRRLRTPATLMAARQDPTSTALARNSVALTPR